MLLAIFHPHITHLLHCKFQLNSLCGLPECPKQIFKMAAVGANLGFPIDTILARFDPEVVLLL